MSVGAKELKIQIAFKVNKVSKKSYYGIDKSLVEKIEVGDIVLIQSNFEDAVTPRSTGKSWEIIITNKGISKTFSSTSRLVYLFNRVTEYEQLGLV